MNNLINLMENCIGEIPNDLKLFQYVVASLIFVYTLGFVFDLITLMFPRSWRK